MRFYSLKPEVAGGLGKETVMDREVSPPSVVILHYELEGWLGDDLLETFPCFIVSRRLAQEIVGNCLSGCELVRVKVTTSRQFRELYPNRGIPEFEWLKITGRVGVNDFGIAADNRLVVSDRALSILRSFNLQNCDVCEYPGLQQVGGH